MIREKGGLAGGIARHVMCCLETIDGVYRGGEDRGPSSDPNHLDRPPSLEETELEKPLPMRKGEGGNRILRRDNVEVAERTGPTSLRPWQEVSGNGQE